MNDFNANETALIERFRNHLDILNNTSEAQHIIIKAKMEDAGTSINFVVPVKVPDHFLKKDEVTATPDTYLSYDEGIHEMSEMLPDGYSLEALSVLIKMIEDVAGVKPLFIRPASSLTSLFISTPQVLLLMVLE